MAANLFLHLLGTATVSPAVKSGLLAPAGAIVGPTLLVVTTELGQILPYATCGSPVHSPALVAFGAALLAIAASLISWRAAQPNMTPRGVTSAYPTSFGFVGRLSALAGLIFAYALALQGFSAIVLTGCER